MRSVAIGIVLQYEVDYVRQAVEGAIAERCGFPDYVRFTKVFRRLVGRSPTQYRSEHGTP